MPPAPPDVPARVRRGRGCRMSPAPATSTARRPGGDFAARAGNASRAKAQPLSGVSLPTNRSLARSPRGGAPKRSSKNPGMRVPALKRPKSTPLKRPATMLRIPYLLNFVRGGGRGHERCVVSVVDPCQGRNDEALEQAYGQRRQRNEIRTVVHVVRVIEGDGRNPSHPRISESRPPPIAVCQPLRLVDVDHIGPERIQMARKHLECPGHRIALQLDAEERAARDGNGMHPREDLAEVAWPVGQVLPDWRIVGPHDENVVPPRREAPAALVHGNGGTVETGPIPGGDDCNPHDAPAWAKQIAPCASTRGTRGILLDPGARYQAALPSRDAPPSAGQRSRPAAAPIPAP